MESMPAFWSGETLKVRLPKLIEPFDDKRVDCAAYTLSVGPEVYVSPSDQTQSASSVTVRKLASDEAFTIPPGQFAFLLTEEIVRVPLDALAFISIRAKTKFKGLMNVSGFHVDPGFRGQLTFAVFNAGPVSIHLKRGQSIFLIWYAALDRETELGKTSEIRRGIDTDLITGISGELQSFASLAKKIKDVEKSTGDRIHQIEKEHVRIMVIAGIISTIVVGAAITWIRHTIESSSNHPTTMAATPMGISNVAPLITSQTSPTPITHQPADISAVSSTQAAANQPLKNAQPAPTP